MKPLLTSACLFVLSFFVLNSVGCGATATNDGSSEPLPSSASSAPDAAVEVPASPAETHSGSTISFDPSKVTATRQPAHAGCGEKNAPFTDDDLFTIQAVRAPADNDRIQSIAITFSRKASVGAPVALMIGGPVRGVLIGDGMLQARATDDRIGPDVTVFHPGFTTDAPPVSTLAKASVTVLAVGTMDGELLAARVVLQFVDGAVLDASYAAPLTSFAGSCGD